jgi:hypothetical protein
MEIDALTSQLGLIWLNALISGKLRDEDKATLASIWNRRQKGYASALYTCTVMVNQLTQIFSSRDEGSSGDDENGDEDEGGDEPSPALAAAPPTFDRRVVGGHDDVTDHDYRAPRSAAAAAANRQTQSSGARSINTTTVTATAATAATPATAATAAIAANATTVSAVTATSAVAPSAGAAIRPDNATPASTAAPRVYQPPQPIAVQQGVWKDAVCRQISK